MRMAATLNLTPESSVALSKRDRAYLGNRAVEMKVHIGAKLGKQPRDVFVRGSWWHVEVEAWHGPQNLETEGSGNLADLIESVLDAFEEDRAQGWTAEELVQIAAQSGISVERA